VEGEVLHHHKIGETKREKERRNAAHFGRSQTCEIDRTKFTTNTTFLPFTASKPLIHLAIQVF
jgi:hypothetical protein